MEALTVLLLPTNTTCTPPSNCTTLLHIKPTTNFDQSINRSTTHQSTQPITPTMSGFLTFSPAARSAQPPATPPPPSSSPSPPNPSASQPQDKPAARPKARTPTRPTPPAKRTSWTCSLPTARRRESKLRHKPWLLFWCRGQY